VCVRVCVCACMCVCMCVFVDELDGVQRVEITPKFLVEKHRLCVALCVHVYIFRIYLSTVCECVCIVVYV